MRSKKSLSNTPPSGKEPLPPEALELATEIKAFLEQKKIDNLKWIDLSRVNPYFQYFLIATAQSPLQLKSLARELQKRFPARGRLRPEDLDSGWVILDYIDVVVHLFLKEQRDYYRLEQLWGDALFLA